MNQNRLATIISWLFNPLIMPTIGLLIIFFSNTYLSLIPFEGKKMIFILVISGTCLVPLSFLPVFYYFRLIRNVEMERSERIVPLFITAVVYFITFYIMRGMPFPYINAFIFASALAVFLNAIIALFWKISSHMIGIGGIVGLVVTLFIRYNADIKLMIIPCILVAGLLGYSRLQLGKHSPTQIYSGFILGLVIVTGILVI